HDVFVSAALPTHLPARPLTLSGDEPTYVIDAPTNGKTPSVARTQRTSPRRLTPASYAARMPVSKTPRFCVTPAKESDWPRHPPRSSRLAVPAATPAKGIASSRPPLPICSTAASRYMKPCAPTSLPMLTRRALETGRVKRPPRPAL